MGLQGMINDLIESSDFLVGEYLVGEISAVKEKNVNAIARLISAAENCPDKHSGILSEIKELATQSDTPVLGITGTGGAGKTVSYFCKKNDIIKWDGKGSKDVLIYLNGLTYFREFTDWNNQKGYSLLIGKKRGPKSKVIWDLSLIHI